MKGKNPERKTAAHHHCESLQSLKYVCLYVTISTPDTHSFEDVGLTCTPVAYARPSKKDSAPRDNIGVLGKITFVLGLKSQPLLFSVFSNYLSSSSEDFSFLGFVSWHMVSKSMLAFSSLCELKIENS